MSAEDQSGIFYFESPQSLRLGNVELIACSAAEARDAVQQIDGTAVHRRLFEDYLTRLEGNGPLTVPRPDLHIPLPWRVAQSGTQKSTGLAAISEWWLHSARARIITLVPADTDRAATESLLQSLIRFCFEQLALHRVEYAGDGSGVERTTTAALGLRPEAVLRSALADGEHRLDVVLYGMLKDDIVEVG